MRWLGAVAVCLVLVLALAFARDAYRLSDADGRTDHLMGFSLPDEATAVIEGGDASNPLLRAVGLDRERSVAFHLDVASVDEFLDQFGEFEARPGFPGGGSPSPSGTLIFSGRHDWLSHAEVVERFTVADPPAGADFTNIFVYAIDEATVGIWIHSDWN